MELKSLVGRVGVGCSSLCKYHRMARKAMPRKRHTVPVASNWMVTGDIPVSAPAWLAEAPPMVSCAGGGGDWSCSSRMAGMLGGVRGAVLALCAGRTASGRLVTWRNSCPSAYICVLV
eukprot:scaffold100677_cov63-Phaeocystis_antarctica.AAC.4